MNYSGHTLPDTLNDRLGAAPRGNTGPAGDTSATITAAYITVLATINAQIETLATQIAAQLDQHPDAPIFTSLPRSGRVRAARLLAEIGDARARFPTADSLACLGGVAPSTRQSGKIKAVTFRWAADKQLRDALCDFAGDSRRANPWAADLYQRARDRGHDHPPRRAHPRPRLGRHHLDLLDHQHALPPQQTRRTSTHPQPRSTDRSLTQGNSHHILGGWPRLYQTNHTQIPHPQLIYPGQHLALP